MSHSTFTNFDYTVNTHPTFTCVKPSDFCKTQDCMDLCCRRYRNHLSCLRPLLFASHEEGAGVLVHTRRETDKTVSHIFGFRARNKHTQVRQMAFIFSKPELVISFSCLVIILILFYCICVLLPHVLVLCVCLQYSFKICVLMFKLYRECHRVHSSTSRCRGPSAG